MLSFDGLCISQSIALAQAFARKAGSSSSDSLRLSSLEASLAVKEDSLKAAAATSSSLLADVDALRTRESVLAAELSTLERKIREKKLLLTKEELFRDYLSSCLRGASHLKVTSADDSYAKSLALCDLVKELLDALGARHDDMPANASVEDACEWLHVNLCSLAKVCMSFSFDTLMVMVRDLLHSLSCKGSEAIDLIRRSEFSMEPSDSSPSLGAAEAKCFKLVNDFWWNRVKRLAFDGSGSST